MSLLLKIYCSPKKMKSHNTIVPLIQTLTQIKMVTKKQMMPSDSLMIMLPQAIQIIIPNLPMCHLHQTSLIWISNQTILQMQATVHQISIIPHRAKVEYKVLNQLQDNKMLHIYSISKMYRRRIGIRQVTNMKLDLTIGLAEDPWKIISEFYSVLSQMYFGKITVGTE
jgi:hypothetical protein